MSGLYVPARVTPGMFSNERVVTAESLDGNVSAFVQEHFIGSDNASVLVTRRHVGLTWEVLGIPTQDGCENVLLRRGVAK